MDKLAAFINAEIFETIKPDEQRRLNDQLGAMMAYQDILTERIAHFEDDGAQKAS